MSSRHYTSKVNCMTRLLAALLIPFCVATAVRAENPLDAHWIWFDEGEPGVEAPAGKVWFRYEARASEPSTAVVRVAADDGFVLWANGRRVGEGEGGRVYRYHLNGIVERGVNVIAVEAYNRGGPAGLLVDGEIRGQGGGIISLDTSGAWDATREEPQGEEWLQPGFRAAGWRAARDLGLHPNSPWRNLPYQEGYLDRFQVPEGFELERIAEPELVGSLVCLTWGRGRELLVSREGGPILTLHDEDGDGRYDRAAEFSTEVANCQGLCLVGDDLYAVGHGPQGAGMYLLPDRNRDGRADEVRPLARVRGGIGEHGPHAVVLGPDGWLYHALGNHAFIREAPEPTSSVRNPYEGDLLQPRFEDGHGHAAGIKVPAGTIWRFAPDGRHWWLETAGFRNQYDIAFNQWGELFTFDSDMEWDVGQPWYRPVRINHCVPGADFGWRSGTANWPAYYYDSLPAAVDIGRGSPTGVVFYEHRQFPARYQGAFLVCDWSLGRIIAVLLRPQGASYAATWETLASGNPLNVSDIEVDRDGSVVFCTGGRGTEGGVYRLSYPAGREQAAFSPPATLEQLLDLPQPQAAWHRQEAERVKASLGHAWQRELSAAARSPSPSRQVRALALMCQLGPQPELDLLLSLTADPSPAVRATAVWLLSAYQGREVQQAMTRLLADPEPRVARRACEALVRSGQQPLDIEPLAHLAGRQDRFLAYAARAVLERTPLERWQDLLLGGTARQRLTGLLALHRLGAEAMPPQTLLEQAVQSVESLLSQGPTVELVDALRLAELALLACKEQFVGQGMPPERAALAAAELAPARRLGRLLLDRFPASQQEDHAVEAYNRECARLLAFLQVEEAAPLLVGWLEAGPTQEDRLHAALCLRYLHVGWDLSLRRRLLDWYESTQQWEGGHSLRANIDNIVAATLEACSPQQRSLLLQEWPARPRAAELLLRVSGPEQIGDYEQRLLEILQQVEMRPELESGPAVASAAMEALARSRTPHAQAMLRKLYEQFPDRRDVLARLLAENAVAEDWPLLLSSLQHADKVTMQLVLAALLRIPRRPEKAEEYRAVILAGLKLGQEGGLTAVELLRRWTGVAHRGGLDAVAALAEYQQWFRETFPDAPPPELPQDDAEASRYTFDELLRLLSDETLARQGDATRGAAVFAKARCNKCHRFLNQGEGVGPDLTAVRRRFQRKEIIEAVIFPSQVVSDQFRSVTALTHEGQVFTGMPLPQSNADKIVLLLPDATRLELARERIEEIAPSKQSVMPVGLLKELSPAEIIDLFAFLETSKQNAPPSGSEPSQAGK
jgi:putative membrane-bound dehydrogenase-like protein